MGDLTKPLPHVVTGPIEKRREIAGRIENLWAITKAALYCTSRSRESCKAECPFAPLPKIAMAERMSRKQSLRLAKIVPEVSENWQPHSADLQRHILRRGRFQRSQELHLGQKASPYSYGWLVDHATVVSVVVSAIATD